jgi:hypothetical protein
VNEDTDATEDTPPEEELTVELTEEEWERWARVISRHPSQAPVLPWQRN